MSRNAKRWDALQQLENKLHAQVKTIHGLERARDEEKAEKLETRRMAEAWRDAYLELDDIDRCDSYFPWENYEDFQEPRDD